MRMEELFPVSRPVIGVVHLPALPGAPFSRRPIGAIRRRALADAGTLARAGVEGVILENFGDGPYRPGRVPAHTVAHMSVLAAAVREAHPDLALGINVLRNDGEAALSAAAAAGADFIRVNVWAGARLTDQGIVEGVAHRVVRLRRRLEADVRIFADVAVKHSASLAERPLAEEVAETVGRARADAVIVTGAATGAPADRTRVAAAKEAAGGAPVLVGSGVTVETAAEILGAADGVIVGTALKEGGEVTAPVDPERTRLLVERALDARG